MDVVKTLKGGNVVEVKIMRMLRTVQLQNGNLNCIIRIYFMDKRIQKLLGYKLQIIHLSE